MTQEPQPTCEQAVEEQISDSLEKLEGISATASANFWSDLPADSQRSGHALDPPCNKSLDETSVQGGGEGQKRGRRKWIHL